MMAAAIPMPTPNAVLSTLGFVAEIDGCSGGGDDGGGGATTSGTEMLVATVTGTLASIVTPSCADMAF